MTNPLAKARLSGIAAGDNATTNALRKRAEQVESRVEWLLAHAIERERIRLVHDLDCPLCHGAGAVRLFADDETSTSPCQLCTGVMVLPHTSPAIDDGRRETPMPELLRILD